MIDKIDELESLFIVKIPPKNKELVHELHEFIIKNVIPNGRQTRGILN
jgi:hypothetical protein